MATFRYLVDDVTVAANFYVRFLGFELKQQFGPAMAILAKGDMQLWLAGPMSSAGQPMPDGRKPAPGGWNRIVVQVENLASVVDQLKDESVLLRNDIVQGPGGSQILCEDPSGNPIEIFQPR